MKYFRKVYHHLLSTMGNGTQENLCPKAKKQIKGVEVWGWGLQVESWLGYMQFSFSPIL